MADLSKDIQGASNPAPPCGPFVLEEHLPNGDQEIAPPDPEGWEREWHGYYQRVETRTEENRQFMKRLLSLDYYHAYILERFCLLSVLNAIGPRHVTFFELGSGRAPWCMTTAGTVRFHLVPHCPVSCRCLALEGEPTHYQWSREHILRQGIDAEVVWGAIGSVVAACRFMATSEPAAHMGQAVNPNGNIVVPMYTIDFLRQTFLFDHIHVVHMDVQGMEVEALKGARLSLAEKRIDYIIVGTHGPQIEQQLQTFLTATHDLVVELPAGGEARLPGISKPFRSPDDGVHLYRRKGLT